jgi:hypothetical protein
MAALSIDRILVLVAKFRRLEALKMPEPAGYALDNLTHLSTVVNSESEQKLDQNSWIKTVGSKQLDQNSWIKTVNLQ